MFLFWIFSLVPLTLHGDPKKHVFGMGRTWFAGSAWDFSHVEHTSHKLYRRDFCWASKTHYSKIFGRAVLGRRPKSSFFRKKNPVDCTWLSFCFGNGPTLLQQIQEQWKIRKIEVFVFECKNSCKKVQMIKIFREKIDKNRFVPWNVSWDFFLLRVLSKKLRQTSSKIRSST